MEGGGELKQSGMEQGTERTADSDEASSRMGVEVSTGCRDVTSAGEDSLVSVGQLIKKKKKNHLTSTVVVVCDVTLDSFFLLCDWLKC